MRYTTDQMRAWAGPLDKLDEDCGGSNVAMKEAADEIDRLREVLATIADGPWLITAKPPAPPLHQPPTRRAFDAERLPTT